MIKLIKHILDDLRCINSNKKSMIFNFFLCNSFHVIFLYRVSNFLVKIKFEIFGRIINALSRIVYCCDISPFATIGSRCLLMHGFSIVIGSDVVIGDNAKIYNDTTIGNRKGTHEDGQATIGDGVIIGVGARILGNVRVGDNVSIGANAVVLNDIPSNSIAVGVPARYKSKC